MILMLDEYGTVPYTTFADLAVPHISKNEPVGCRRVSQTDPLIFLSLYIDLHEQGLPLKWLSFDMMMNPPTGISPHIPLHDVLAKSVDNIMERLVETSLAKSIATA